MDAKTIQEILGKALESGEVEYHDLFIFAEGYERHVRIGEEPGMLSQTFYEGVQSTIKTQVFQQGSDGGASVS